jgi:hypothetical protein
MKKYEVMVDLQSFIIEVEAENVEDALEKAYGEATKRIYENARIDQILIEGEVVETFLHSNPINAPQR